MIKNLIDYLENSSKRFKDKIAIEDKNTKLSFKKLVEKSKVIGCLILKSLDVEKQNQAIVVFLPKSCDLIISFLATLYSGNFYIPLDINSPKKRISKILYNAKPKILLSKKKYKKKIKETGYKGKIIFIDAIKYKNNKKNKDKLNSIMNLKIDCDPAYAIPTSGTTGIPKLVLISHRSVIDYIEWAKECFAVSNKEIIGNQAQFYFDNSTLDIYLMLSTGCKLVIIPEEKFSFPVELINYINKKKISFIFWVPSVLINIANVDALSKTKLKYLKQVLFAGEVMPNKHLNYWRTKYPKVFYSNLYGPTEITVDCTYYKVLKKFNDNENLPIGFPCKNSNILILNKRNKLCKINEVGQLCVRGTSLALGYYNDEKKTNEVFIQNPLNKSYKEKIYLTGDHVYENKSGEIIFVGRKDAQIKHLGYRIELQEIENEVFHIKEIKNACALYNFKKKYIALFYTGNISGSKIYVNLSKVIPKYMIPTKYFKLTKFPMNSNRKIDKKKLLKSF